MLKHYVHPSHHLSQEEVFACFVEGSLFALVPSLLSREAEALGRRPCWGCGAIGGGREGGGGAGAASTCGDNGPERGGDRACTSQADEVSGGCHCSG